MKKIALFVVTAVLLISPLVAAVSTTSSFNTTRLDTKPTSKSMNFTHTVFIEECTVTTCPYCPLAAEALYSIYNSSDYPFYYIALVYDENILAAYRFWIHYRATAFPSLFFDGGRSQAVGAGTTPQQTEQLYRPLIEKAGNQTVHPLEITTNVIGHDNAKLDITVTVKNTGTKLYIGFVRSYITEIVSRWKDSQNKPYHFGFLDYAIKKVIILSPQKSRTFTMTWDGAKQHGNLTFPDIVDNNIMVISTVAHLQPHIIAKEEYIDQHFAFYVDQTAMATVE
jgi:hypothetical protein